METLQRTANRGSVPTGYEIDNSLKIEADNSEYLSQTIGAGSRTTATYSFWFKRTELGADMQIAGISPIGSETTRFIITSNDVLDVESGVGGDNNSLVTNRVFRDTASWYHFVVAIDTTQSTEANRVKVYVNGVQETSFSASEYPAQNTNLTIGVSGYTWRYGAYDNTYIKSSGYLAEAYYIDAQQLDPTSFGEFDEDTGIWKPIAYTGSFGSNGHYLDFKNAGDLGNNSSGVGNNFTLNNITSADQATDTPTNNFAIPNVIGTTRLNKFTYTEGGTKVVSAGSTDWDSWANTIAVGNGKWYAEFKIINTGNYFVGVGSEEYYFVGAGSGTGWPEIYYGYSGTNSVGFYNSNGDIYNNGTQVVIGTTYTANDIISVALDMDNGKVYFAKNGTYIDSQNPVTGTNAQNLPDTEARYFIGTTQYQANLGVECNYGGYTTTSIASSNSDANNYGTFEYAPPSGYYALCSQNLAEFG